MDASPFHAPTYFPPSYFYGQAASPAAKPVDSPVAKPVDSPVAAPFYAPSYFPPSYFYGRPSPPAAEPVDSPVDSPAARPFHAPTYFPPSYFYGPAAPPAVPARPRPRGRDPEAYAALLSLIRSTGAFEEVAFGGGLPRGRAGADGYPLAVLTPRGWEEADDTDPTLIVRRSSFAITIAVKGRGEEPGFDDLEGLASLVRDAVEFSDLGGAGLAPLTRIRSGRYAQAASYPERSIELVGEFSTLIDPPPTPTPE